MIKQLLIFLFIIFTLANQAQTNLVPNPSFETYTTCPTSNGNIINAIGWLSFTDSPDYFNSCVPVSDGLNVPHTALGYQQAFDGNAYAGAYQCASYANPPPNLREYFGIQLIQPLVIGQKYFVTFQVSLGAAPSYDCWSNKIGAKFTTFYYTAPEGDTALVTNSAQVYSDSLLKDTMNWTQIKGSFVADSAYKYIVLGNFFDDAHTDTLKCYGAVTYVFFDLVCVSTDSLQCNSTVGITKESNNSFFSVYPNPCSNKLNIKCSEIPKTIEIYDVLGNKHTIVSVQLSNNNFIIDTSILSDGIYILKVNSQSQSIQKQIIISK